MKPLQKVLWFILTAGVITLLWFYAGEVIIINKYVLVASALLSLILPKIFAMGVSDEEHRGIIVKIICMGFMTGLIFLTQVAQNPLACGVYTGILIPYAIRVAVKKVIK